MADDQKKFMFVAGGILLVAAVGIVAGYVIYDKKKDKKTCDCGLKSSSWYLRVGDKYLSMVPVTEADPTHAQVTTPSIKDNTSRWSFYDTPYGQGTLCMCNYSNQTMFMSPYPTGDVHTQKKMGPDGCAEWERITPEFINGSKTRVALKTYHGTYIGLDSTNTAWVNTAKTIGANETFELTKA